MNAALVIVQNGQIWRSQNKTTKITRNETEKENETVEFNRFNTE